MDKFENLQTSSENKQHYIPMEVTAETIKDFGINPADVVWTRIGNRKVGISDFILGFLVKFVQGNCRLLSLLTLVLTPKRTHKCFVLLLRCRNHNDTDSDLEADVMKKMLIDELHKALDELEELDRTIMEMYSKNHSEAEIGQAIGMSQKGVNKRKHKVLLKLNTRLKDFR